MIMPVVVGNTARIHATSQLGTGVSSVDNQQFDREFKYQVSMSIVRKMLERGLIDADTFAKWQERLIARFDPPIGRIVSNREG